MTCGLWHWIERIMPQRLQRINMLSLFLQLRVVSWGVHATAFSSCYGFS